jgi:ubiquinone/menaquinone biosynthesis C-methylase UbiE
LPDAHFEVARLAEAYDLLEGERFDLAAYVSIASELGARSVLDIGCGTGTFACLLAGKGNEVIALDPARASLHVARRKPMADRVQWVLGDATAVPPSVVDLVTMTGNVAQVFLTDQDWEAALAAARGALRDGGHLVFETRDPSYQAWREWNRETTHRLLHLPDAGTLETWTDVVDVTLPFVSFRQTFVFVSDGATYTSDSTLRFRQRAEAEDTLQANGFDVEDVRDAPDRPGREFVFVARRRSAMAC